MQVRNYLTGRRIDMAEAGRNDPGTGDPDSRGSIWRAIRSLFDGGEADQSLRAQIEEAIEEHEGGGGGR